MGGALAPAFAIRSLGVVPLALAVLQTVSPHLLAAALAQLGSSFQAHGGS